MEQPTVQLLAICEMSAGQQLLTCVCHCTQWNPLVQSAQIAIPEGYRLMSVSSAQAGELFWSVRNGMAEIQLNDLSTSEFFLELKLLCEIPTRPQEQQISIARFGQIIGTIRSANSWVAVRTTPEFTVQQPESGVISNLVAAELPSGFAGWLRRADSLYQVPSVAQDITFQLLPRTSYSEVRVAQSVVCGESWIDWTYTADIETAVLGRFRHQMIVDPAIEITDVQVFAGEANRLDKRYLRGDRLMILLKEGTTGLYRLTLRGRQHVMASDSEVQLRCPHLQEIPILESSLTIVDNSQAGYILADTGTAVPDRRLQPEQILPQGAPLRLQIVDETEPVILRRRSLASRDASLAIIRHNDRAIVLLQVESFPAAAVSDSMSFASDVVFLEPPRVLLNGDVRNSVRTGNDFRWNVPSNLTDNVTLTAFWVVPRPSADADNAPMKNAISLPAFSFDLKWKQTVMADNSAPSQTGVVVETAESDASLSVDVSPDSNASAAREPARRRQNGAGWIADALQVFEVEDIETEMQFSPVEISELLSVENAILPDTAPTTSSETTGRLKPLIVADTVLLVTPHQSAVAETTFVVFTQQPGTRLTLQIPPQTVVTRISSEHTVRRDQPVNNKVLIDLTQNVTTLRLRWLSQRATGTMFQSRLQLIPPVPTGATVHHLMSIHSTDSGASHFTSSAHILDETQFRQKLQSCLREGLEQLAVKGSDAGGSPEAEEPGLSSSPAFDASGLFSEAPLLEERIIEIEQSLNRDRSEFLASSVVRQNLSASQLPPDSEDLWRTYSTQTDDPLVPPSLQIAIRRIPSLATLLPYLVAVAIMLLAIVGRRDDSEVDSRDDPFDLQEGVDGSAATWQNAPGLSVSAADVLALSGPVQQDSSQAGTIIDRSPTSTGTEDSASGISSG